MALLDKLLMARQLRFEDGNIYLLNQRVFMSTDGLLIAISKFLDQNPQFIAPIYESIRTETFRKWGSTIRDKYKMGPTEFINLMLNISSMAGWGKGKLLDFNAERLEGKMQVVDAPVAVNLKGVVQHPCEHIWRAITAGTSSAIFQKDIDWVETKCMAFGGNVCEVYFKLRENWTAAEKQKFPFQIP